jgi:hypothetical protein
VSSYSFEIKGALLASVCAATCQRRGWDIERDTIAKIEGGTQRVDFTTIKRTVEA